MIHLNFNDIKYSKYTGPLDRPESEPIEYELMKEMHMQFNELKTITRKDDDESSLPIINKGKVNYAKLNQ